MAKAGELAAQGEVLGDQVDSVLEGGDAVRDREGDLEGHGVDGRLGEAEAGNEELHASRRQ